MVQPMMMSHQPMMFPPLLKTVQDCLNVCEHMVTAMIGAPDVQARRMQIHLLRDCATICATMASYLASYSMFSKATAGLCSQICEMCGNECAKFPDQMSQMCSRVCLNCAQECRAFAMAQG